MGTGSRVDFDKCRVGGTDTKVSQMFSVFFFYYYSFSAVGAFQQEMIGKSFSGKSNMAL